MVIMRERGQQSERENSSRDLPASRHHISPPAPFVYFGGVCLRHACGPQPGLENGRRVPEATEAETTAPRGQRFHQLARRRSWPAAARQGCFLGDAHARGIREVRCASEGGTKKKRSRQRKQNMPLAEILREYGRANRTRAAWSQRRRSRMPDTVRGGCLQFGGVAL